jgi:Ca-activated chloride channel homolog
VVGASLNPETRPFRFGDQLEQVDFTESIRNAQINHGIESFNMQEDDLKIRETDFKAQTSTVLMIDISHSMILYGEDRITPAKKVAMALSELITTKYPKDTLDIVVFGNDAWPVEIKDLPYLQVGPYHTNTVAGLELAMDILRRRRNANKQIFMITDGKPTCLKVGKRYYKNSFGLDRKITSRCLNLAAQCKKLKIPITTFMIASDPYLQRFVNEFTETNNGKAFFASLDRLGSFIFRDFESGKRKTVY